MQPILMLDFTPCGFQCSNLTVVFFRLTLVSGNSKLTEGAHAWIVYKQKEKPVTQNALEEALCSEDSSTRFVIPPEKRALDAIRQNKMEAFH